MRCGVALPQVARLQALDLDQPLAGVDDVEVEEPEEAQTIQQLARDPRLAGIKVRRFKKAADNRVGPSGWN